MALLFQFEKAGFFNFPEFRNKPGVLISNFCFLIIKIITNYNSTMKKTLFRPGT